MHHSNFALFNVITPQSITELNIITDIVLAMIGYLIGGSLRIKTVRGLGKSIVWVTVLYSLGSWIGTTISHARDSVRKYLGFALLPQAGVTIGLVIVASQ